MIHPPWHVALCYLHISYISSLDVIPFQFWTLRLTEKIKERKKKKASLGAQVNKTIHDGGVFSAWQPILLILQKYLKRKDIWWHMPFCWAQWYSLCVGIPSTDSSLLSRNLLIYLLKISPVSTINITSSLIYGKYFTDDKTMFPYTISLNPHCTISIIIIIIQRETLKLSNFLGFASLKIQKPGLKHKS